MKKIEAYEALDGSIHATEQDALDKDKTICFNQHIAELVSIINTWCRRYNGYSPMTSHHAAELIHSQFVLFKKEMERYNAIK